MEQNSKFRSKYKCLGLVIFLCFICGPLFGESKKAIPIISDKLLTAGVNFEIKFEIERLNYSEPKLTYAREPQGFSIIDVPTFSYNQENPETPGIISVVLKCKTVMTGYFTVPVTYFNFPEGDQVSSELTLLAIGLKAHPQFVPPDLEWQLASGPFYRGQSIHVELRLLYAKGLLIPQKVQVPAAEGLVFSPSTYLSSSQDMMLAGTPFRSIPVLSYTLVPQRSGLLRLPELKLEFAEFSRVAPSKTFQIAEVPISNSRALGSFEFNLVQDKSNWSKDQNIILRLITRGRGNFASFNPPTPQFGELGLMNKETRFSTRETLLGTEGYREDIFSLKAGTVGSYPVIIEGFTIFDTESGRERVVDTLTTTVKVVDIAKNQITESPKISKFFFDSLSFGLGLCVVSAGITLGFLGFKLKRIKIAMLILAGSLVAGGAVYLIAHFPFITTENELAMIPSLYDAGDISLSYNYLLSGLTKYPGNLDLINFAQSVGFPSPGLQLPSTILWIIDSVLLLTLGPIILAFKRGNKPITYLLRFLALSLFLTFTLTGSNWINVYNYSGIIGHQGSQVRSINSVSAKPFSVLNEGTVVSVIDTYKEFSLIETSNHIKGWILSNDISKRD